MRYLKTENIPLEQIEMSKYGLRTETAEKELGRLAKSIKQHGLIHAIAVRENPVEDGKPYLLVAGYRRYMAHRQLKEEGIRADVWEANEKEARDPGVFEKHAEAAVLASNLVFQPLSLLELGRRHAKWVQEFGMSPKQVAETLDEDLNFLEETLKLARIAPEAQEVIEANPGTITLGRMLALAEEAPSTPPEAQVKLAQWLVNQEADETGTWDRKSIHAKAKEARHQWKEEQYRLRHARPVKNSHGEPWIAKKLFGYVEDAEYALWSFKSIRCPEDVSFSGITDLEERINILAQRWPEALAELKAQLAGSQDQSVSPEVEPATVQG